MRFISMLKHESESTYVSMVDTRITEMVDTRITDNRFLVPLSFGKTVLPLQDVRGQLSVLNIDSFLLSPLETDTDYL